MLSGRRPIIYGDGEQKRNFSDVNDCIFCLDKLLFDPNIQGQIVNIGPDEENISINDLFKKISNKLAFNKQPIFTKDRPNEVKDAFCSSEKARKILGYKTLTTLDQSIDKVIEFVKKSGTKPFEYNYTLEIINKETPKTWIEKIF
jgi:UDP-glucose 4-epimerase